MSTLEPTPSTPEPSTTPELPTAPINWAHALDVASASSKTPLTTPDNSLAASRPRAPKSKGVPPALARSAKNRKAPQPRKPEQNVAPLGRALPQDATTPWTTAFVVQTGFALKSKSNFRRYKGGRNAYLWRSLTDFEKALGALLTNHLPLTWELAADKPVDERPVVLAVIIGRTTHDAANLSKSVLDAAQGVVVANDATIRFVSESSIRTKKGQSGIIAFAALPPKTPLHQILAAGATLLHTVAAELDEQGYLLQP